MGIERRRAERVRVNLDVIFAEQSRQHKGTISDISVTGCFVLASSEATPSAPITVMVQLPTNKSIRLTGEVVYNTPEIGFAIRFTRLSKSGQSFVEKLIERFRQPPVEPAQTIEQ